jgi:hypothetical protein
MKERIDGLLGLHLRHARAIRHAVDDVEFNHAWLASVRVRQTEIGL